MPITMNPVPLGKVAVAAAGTPVRLTANFPSDSEFEQMVVSKLNIQALTDNTGPLYLGYADMNRTTLAGVLAIIPQGSTWAFGEYNALNTIKPHDLYLDADNNGDAGLVSAHIR
jgi:hypothetical protein